VTGPFAQWLIILRSTEVPLGVTRVDAGVARSSAGVNGR
jgi:hypothetical protein